MHESSARYSAIAQSFHWLTAIVVLVAFIYGPGGSETRVYSSVRDFDRQLHETLGLTVFVLIIARLAWRMIGARSVPPAIPRWMDRGSKVVQALLYVLLLALPITAVAGAWLEAHSLTLLGGIEIKSPLAAKHDLGAQLASVHGWLGDAVMWLAGMHAAAALFHHIVLRDGVLVSMLPPWIPLRRRVS